MALPEGYGMIAGRGRDHALGALAAAEKAGLPAAAVTTTEDGYLVPLAVLDIYEAGLKASTPKAAPAPAAAPKKSAAPAKKTTDPSDESPSGKSNVKH